jgi:hypothetical protein
MWVVMRYSSQSGYFIGLSATLSISANGSGTLTVSSPSSARALSNGQFFAGYQTWSTTMQCDQPLKFTVDMRDGLPTAYPALQYYGFSGCRPSGNVASDCVSTPPGCGYPPTVDELCQVFTFGGGWTEGYSVSVQLQATNPLP